MKFSKNLKWNFLNSFFHFPKTKTKQKKENWNAFTNSISLIGDPGDEDTPITWCLYLLQACLIKILLSTWSLSQEERENEESKEKLENLRYIQKDLRLCFRWVKYHSFAVFFSRLVKHMQFLFVTFKHCLDACLDINTFYVTALKRALFIWWRSSKYWQKLLCPQKSIEFPDNNNNNGAQSTLVRRGL